MRGVDHRKSADGLEFVRSLGRLIRFQCSLSAHLIFRFAGRVSVSEQIAAIMCCWRQQCGRLVRGFSQLGGNDAKAEAMLAWAASGEYFPW